MQERNFGGTRKSKSHREPVEYTNVPAHYRALSIVSLNAPAFANSAFIRSISLFAASELAADADAGLFLRRESRGCDPVPGLLALFLLAALGVKATSSSSSSELSLLLLLLLLLLPSLRARARRAGSCLARVPAGALFFFSSSSCCRAEVLLLPLESEPPAWSVRERERARVLRRDMALALALAPSQYFLSE